MRAQRLFPSAVLALAAAATLAACDDTSTAPADAPVPARPAFGATVTSGTTVTALLWVEPVASSTTVSKPIGPEGGSFSTKSGLKVTVPAGAVSAPTIFTVTRLPGTIVAYDFQPHGTTFKVPLLIEQPLKGTNFFKLSGTPFLTGAYYPDASMLDQSTGTATITEFAPTNITADKSMVRFNVWHFSGWMLSSGITGF